MAVFADETHDEIQLIVDRDYLNDTVTVAVDHFGEKLSIAVPLDQYRKLNQMIGL